MGASGPGRSELCQGRAGGPRTDRSAGEEPAGPRLRGQGSDLRSWWVGVGKWGGGGSGFGLGTSVRIEPAYARGSRQPLAGVGAPAPPKGKAVCLRG